MPPSDNVGPAFETTDDFLSDFLDDVAPSADTPTNEETGEKITSYAPPESSVQSNAAPVIVDDVKKRKVTEKLMKLRDMGQSRILAAVVGDINRYKEFALEQWEFDLLVEVYEDVIGRVGEPHWLIQVMAAEGFIMAPKIKQVFNIRAKEKQIRELQERNAALSAQLNSAVLQGRPVPENIQAELSNRHVRRDGKLMWKIDGNGYFENDEHGQRIKVGDRREKPDPHLDKEMLLRWNQKKDVEAAFNVKYT